MRPDLYEQLRTALPRIAEFAGREGGRTLVTYGDTMTREHYQRPEPPDVLAQSCTYLHPAASDLRRGAHA